jgi:hypothetical protein
LCRWYDYINYSGFDDCNNPLSGTATIPVTPAPPATLTLSTLPSTLNCAAAIAYTSAPVATYTNGATGPCENSGTIPATLTPNWTLCAGGTITINYSGLDDCGNTLSASATIAVTPAPPAALTLPTLPATLNCAAATAYTSAPIATYTNGATGPCENSGTIPATVTPNWTLCAGGTITINYSGVDDCGNPLTGSATIAVTPAPPAVLTLPTLPSTLNCAAAIAYTSAPVATYTNGATGPCENSGTIPATLTPNWTLCTGGTITINYTGVDDCGNSLTGSATIAITPAPPAALTLPTLPATLNCAAATAYTSAPIATYTNGATGPCENSGTIPGTVTPNWTLCAGGTITVNYTGVDDCGNALSSSATIAVTPAPPAILTLPTLPTTLDCAAASAFIIPVATYNNGVTGPCENSGTIPGTVIPSSTICAGGTITINYVGTDDCGNPLSSAIAINITPAPPAVLTLPTLPTTLDCAAATAYTSAPNATYTNGATGPCENSGTIPATVTPNWTLCAGGTITVNYTGVDDCGNALSGSATITVTPAPPAVLTLPTLPSTLNCAAATAYTSAPNATYTNGATGPCENSGTIPATVTPNWTLCAGGTITVNYTGVDDCGNPLTGSATIAVTPAPPATLTLPALPATLNCTAASAYTSAPVATYTNVATGACENSGTIPGTVTPNWTLCAGGTITINYSGLDDCGNTLSGSATIAVTPAPPAILTLPTLPATLDCAAAIAYTSAPNATYTNGATGACENSGTIPATVTPNWTLCAGGTITVNYTGVDDCGNTLSGSSTIAVTPAPPAVLTLPTLPATLDCAAATAYTSAPNATYTNGATGPCENSGTIPAAVTPNWTLCAGGSISVNYTGVDDCNNPLSGTVTITVTSAPPAVLTLPTLPATLDCAAATAYTSAPVATIYQWCYRCLREQRYYTWNCYSQLDSLCRWHDHCELYGCG